MSIDPKTAAWWSFAFTVLSVVAAGGFQLAGFPPDISALVKSYAADAAVLVNCANLVFHLYSAPGPGPLAKEE